MTDELETRTKIAFNNRDMYLNTGLSNKARDIGKIEFVNYTINRLKYTVRASAFNKNSNTIFTKTQAPGLAFNTETFIARVLLKRNAGSVVFATVVDIDTPTSGVRAEEMSMIQIMLNPEHINETRIAEFKSDIHIGDLIEFKGKIGVSKTGENTLFVTSYSLHAKCLNTYPKLKKNAEGYHYNLNERTIHDDQTLHHLTSTLWRSNMIDRAHVVSTLRKFYENHDFLEVETPILGNSEGGNANKFTTHANAINSDLKLRISPELYLKEMVIAGLGNVFEIGKNFRNEGIDRTHSPEFTSLEAYGLGSNYLHQMKMMNEILAQLDFDTKNIPVYDFTTLLMKYCDAQYDDLDGFAALNQLGIINGITTLSMGELAEEIFDKFVLPTVEDDIFYIINYPLATSPLSMPNKYDANIQSIFSTAQKWDLYINGVEIATAYTENNNPFELERNFKDTNPEFVNAVRYGMPAIGGIGIGIDRLVAAYINRHTGELPAINDVISFPIKSM